MANFQNKLRYDNNEIILILKLRTNNTTYNRRLRQYARYYGDGHAVQQLFEVSDIQEATQDAVGKNAISFQQKSSEMAPHSEDRVPSRTNIISFKNTVS
jgi:hypothetical protein